MEEEIHLARQAYMDAATELDHGTLGGVMSNPAARALEHVPASFRRRAHIRSWLHSDRARDATIALLHRSTSDRAMTRSLALSSMAKARGGDVAMRVTGAALELVGLRAGPVRAGLEKLWRDAKLTQIYEGTNQLNRLEVYRGLCHGETIHCLPPLRGIHLGADGRAHTNGDTRAHADALRPASVDGDGGRS